MRTLKHKVTVENFIKWIESLTPNQGFVYVDPFNCPIATFLKSLGYKLVSVGATNYGVGNPQIRRDIPLGIAAIINLARDYAYDKCERKLTGENLKLSAKKYSGVPNIN